MMYFVEAVEEGNHMEDSVHKHEEEVIHYDREQKGLEDLAM